MIWLPNQTQKIWIISLVTPYVDIGVGQHCLMAPSQYLNQCRIIIRKVRKDNWLRDTLTIDHKNRLKITSLKFNSNALKAIGLRSKHVHNFWVAMYIHALRFPTPLNKPPIELTTIYALRQQYNSRALYFHPHALYYDAITAGCMYFLPTYHMQQKGRAGNKVQWQW